MQIFTRNTWLLMSFAASVASVGNLNFQNSSFLGIPISISSVTINTTVFSNTGYKQFDWTVTVNTPFTVQNIYLGNQNNYQVIFEENNTENRPFLKTSDAGTPQVFFNTSNWDAGGSISLSDANLNFLQQNYPGDPLFFQVNWVDDTNPLAVEYSYSPVWGLVTDKLDAEALYNSHKDFSSGAALPTAQGTSGLLSPSAQTTTSGPTTTTPTPSSSNEPSSKSSASSKFGPLSTGALVGIIVGGVAFIMLILIIAILCIRRHRRKTRDQGDHDRDAQDLMAEKEARAAGTAPDTPYSVEGSLPLNHGRGISGLNDNPVSRPRTLADGGSQRSSVVYSSLRNVTSVGTGLVGGSGAGDSPTETHPSSSISLHEPYAELVQEQFNKTASHTTADPVSLTNDAETEQSPLSPGSILDEPRPRASGSRAGTPQLGPTRLVRSDTPGGMSISDYLHEDGMTEDEIRRLEEEERALDEAIEQARTDSRVGRGR